LLHKGLSDDPQGFGVLALNGLSFNLSTSNGELMCTTMADIAEFERDQIRERVKSGLPVARANGRRLARQLDSTHPIGRRTGARLAQGRAYRLIARKEEHGDGHSKT
jgi:DNA invertase Pin-like site-specific DNA recombinase